MLKLIGGVAVSLGLIFKQVSLVGAPPSMPRRRRTFFEAWRRGADVLYRPIAETYDCSDASMMYWWLTGSKAGTPADCKETLLRYIGVE